MISKDLLEILCCPETRQPLTEAPPDLLAQANAAITAGKLRNKSGDTIDKPLESGLVRQDGRVMYAVVDGIPIMLADESIPLDGLTANH